MFMSIFYTPPTGKNLYFFTNERLLQSFTNVAMPNINFIEDRGPNQHGTTVRDFRLQPRTINFGVFGKNCFGKQCEYADIVEAVRPTYSSSPGYLRVINQDSSLLEIPAWIQTGPNGNYNVDDGLKVSQVRDSIQFYCPDPVWRDATVTTQSVTVTIEDSCLDMCLPACIGSGLLSAELDICYDGTWYGDQITIVITGPLDTPSITNETTGQSIELNYNVAANDFVTITILPEVATVTSNLDGNIIGSVTSISDLVSFNLLPRQTNTISFGGANGIDGTSAISLSYYTRYISVYDPCANSC